MEELEAALEIIPSGVLVIHSYQAFLLISSPFTLPNDICSATFYGTQVYLGSNLRVRVSLTKRRLADLTDVTLADEDTNSILTENANRASQGNVTMQITQPGGQLWN